MKVIKVRWNLGRKVAVAIYRDHDSNNDRYSYARSLRVARSNLKKGLGL